MVEIPEQPPLMKIAEVARLLDVSTRTVWRYVATGTIPPPIRFTATCVRWRVSDIAGMIEQRAQSR